MAGFIAAGVVRGDVRVVHVAELPKLAAEGAQLLDVRTPAEFNCGHIDGALNVPIDELRDRLGKLDRQKPIVAYCQVGQRGYLASRVLTQAGYGVANLSGGYSTYRQVTL
jgi:rhodanese-related sulfurtransferase